MTAESWVIFQNAVEGWLSPARMPQPTDRTNISQPPQIESRAEFERFVTALRESADRVWPVGACKLSDDGENGGQR